MLGRRIKTHKAPETARLEVSAESEEMRDEKPRDWNRSVSMRTRSAGEFRVWRLAEVAIEIGVRARRPRR